MNNNFWALVLTLGAALAWVRLNEFAAHRGWVETHLSRKIIHMGTGPIFVLCWLLFTDAPSSRYLAVLVPLLITGQFALVGLGVIKDDAAVQAMSRTGDPKEILHGPIFYGVVFVLVTILYWLDSPIGIVALMLMCGGDGLADVLGRRWGKTKLPWAKEKSWAGSFGMLLGGWVFALAVVAVFASVGVFRAPITDYLLPITWIAIAGTMVESIPIRDIDNLTVTATAILLGHILF